MRRALTGTIAGWLAGAASLLAQSPLSVPSGEDDAPPPAKRQPLKSPYAQYSPVAQGAAHFDGAVFDEERRQTLYRGPNGDGPPPLGATGPQVVDCGGRCPNGMCNDGRCSTCGASAGNCRCPDGACGPDGRFWVSGEYLLWWVTGQPLPPLVTTAPAGTAATVAGRLDQPTTSVLFGGNRVFTGVHSGVRARLGGWLDDCQMLGLEGSFTYIGADTLSYMTPCCNGNDIHARPFTDVNPAVNRQNVQFVCFPGTVFGNLTVAGRTDYFGADANLRRNLLCGCNYRMDLIAGYRFLSLNDRLTIQECLVSLLANTAGTTIQVFDHFGTDNRFHGGQIGLAGEFRTGRFFLDWRGSVALGVSVETVTISGNTTFTTPGGASVNAPGGLLAQPSNSGSFYSSDFGVVPEAILNLGFNVSDNVRLWVGYSYLYWSPVVRAGQQIDLTVNSSQLPFAGAAGTLSGAARPAVTFTRSDFFMHGINFGGQLHF